MIQQITIGEKNISYTIIASRRSKKIRLAVHADSKVVLSCPRFVPKIFLKKFLISQSDWLLKSLESFKGYQNNSILGGSKQEYLENKERVKRIISERIEKFNTLYNFKVAGISIRNQRTRWGSCSRHGNLNFNYKIMHLSDRMIDYIVVHELCHLREFNHSINFWNLVAKVIPEHRELRRELRGREKNRQ